MNCLAAIGRGAVWTVLLTAGTALGNDYCPVLPDQAASDRFVATHRGRTIRFCCQNCVKEFDLQPDAYLANLPAEAGSAGPWQWLQGEVLNHYFSPIGPVLRITRIGALGTLLAIGVLAWLQRRGRKAAQPASGRRLGVLVGALLLAVGGVAIHYYRAYYTMIAADNIHYATYYEFGDPPFPQRPDVPRALHGTFYRGNDERSDALFNGGRYRTATFDIALSDDSGTAVSAGEPVAGRALFVDVTIHRAPHTPDFFWKPDRMGRMFLTRHAEPFLGWQTAITDRVDLDTIEPLQRWRARFPVGEVQGDGTQRLAGLIYLCEERYLHGMWAGSRFHYGVRFDLQTRDGVLTTDSELWMNALYRLREVPAWYVPADEWFSAEPIPELPAPQKASPELLGIPEHQAADRAVRNRE